VITPTTASPFHSAEPEKRLKQGKGISNFWFCGKVKA